MMFFAFLRELFGWLLVVTGMVTFFMAVQKVLVDHAACSSLVLGTIGYFVFRGGLHLIKVSLAVRAAAEGRMASAAAIPPRVVRKPVVAKVSLAAPKAEVMPGPKTKPQ